MTSKQLREQLAALIEKGRTVLSKAESDKRTLTAEDNAEIGRIHSEAATIKAQIEVVEHQEKLENDASQIPAPTLAQATAALDRPTATATVEDRDAISRFALNGWALAGHQKTAGAITPQHRAAMQRVGIDPLQSELTMRLPVGLIYPSARPTTMEDIHNAMSVGVDTAGGFLVPKTLETAIEIALLYFGGMRQTATILRTATGEPVSWPTSNDTNNEGTILAENQALDTTGTDVAFGSVVFMAYELTSKLSRVSNTLLRDSAVDVGGLLGRLLGERCGRALNRYCTSGTGASQPNGIMNSATLGITTASGTAVTADEIIKLIHSVDVAYRGPGAGFMMHDLIYLAVSLLKDGIGNYLLQPGLAAGSPDRIRGYPVTINNNMDSTLAASKKTMLFGQLSKFMIREVGTVRLMRLVERFAEYNQTAFCMFMGVDGDMLDAGTHPVKYLLQHP